MLYRLGLPTNNFLEGSRALCDHGRGFEEAERFFQLPKIGTC